MIKRSIVRVINADRSDTTFTEEKACTARSDFVAAIIDINVNKLPINTGCTTHVICDGLVKNNNGRVINSIKCVINCVILE